MPSLQSVRKTLQQPRVALFLLVVAGAVWALMLASRNSPENRLVEAGIAFARQKQGAKAVQAWQQAARMKPDDPRPWQYLSAYYTDVQNWPAAVQSLRHLEPLQPDAPRLHARLALACLRMGDERDAYQYAQQSLKTEPNDPDTIRLLASLMVFTGEDQRRLDLLRRLAQLRPNSPADQMRLAGALVAKALYSQALPVVNRVLRLAPDSLDAYSLRGVITFEDDPSPQGSARAESDFARAARSPRFAPYADFYLGRIYKRLGQPAKAVPLLEAAARAFPNKREVLFSLADAYSQAGRSGKAAEARKRFEQLRLEESQIDALTAKCSTDPRSFDDQLKLGQLLLKHQEYRTALLHLTKAQAIRPGDAGLVAAMRQLARKSREPSAGFATSGSNTAE